MNSFSLSQGVVYFLRYDNNEPELKSELIKNIINSYQLIIKFIILLIYKEFAEVNEALTFETLHPAKLHFIPFSI